MCKIFSNNNDHHNPSTEYTKQLYLSFEGSAAHAQASMALVLQV
jgi:hypothetical protein